MFIVITPQIISAEITASTPVFLIKFLIFTCLSSDLLILSIRFLSKDPQRSKEAFLNPFALNLPTFKS